MCITLRLRGRAAGRLEGSTADPDILGCLEGAQGVQINSEALEGSCVIEIVDGLSEYDEDVREIATGA